jgi:hypothetical protein
LTAIGDYATLPGAGFGPERDNESAVSEATTASAELRHWTEEGQVTARSAGVPLSFCGQGKTVEEREPVK